MILTYISPDGTSTIFSKNAADYRLLKNYTGFTELSPKFEDVAGPTQHGTTLLNTRLEPRDMQFDIMIRADNLTQLRTRVSALTAALNPLNGAGYLFYEYEDGTQYRIKCIGNPGIQLDPTDKSDIHWRGTVILRAHDPFWYSGSAEISYINGVPTAWIPWTMPWTISGFGGTIAITNSGSMETPVIIKIYGPITNPKISNDTSGEDISLNLAIAAGEIFTINTDDDVMTATLTSSTGVVTNGYPYLVSTSTFWKLAAATTSSVTLSSTTGTAGCFASIERSSKYVGR